MVPNFLLNLESSFITPFITDRREKPSPIWFVLHGRQSLIPHPLSTETLGRLLSHAAGHGRRRALRLPSAREEVLSPRMRQRLSVNVNETLGHLQEHRAKTPHYISEKYG